jgi:hypothetical protein
MAVPPTLSYKNLALCVINRAPGALTLQTLPEGQGLRQPCTGHWALLAAPHAARLAAAPALRCRWPCRSEPMDPHMLEHMAVCCATHLQNLERPDCRYTVNNGLDITVGPTFRG